MEEAFAIAAIVSKISVKEMKTLISAQGGSKIELLFQNLEQYIVDQFCF